MFLIHDRIARRLTKDEAISHVYYKLDTAYGSIQATQKKEDQTITLEEGAKSFLKKQPNKQIKNYRGTNSFTAPFSGWEYQVDILHMTPLVKDKDTPEYALVVIDVFRKLADVAPMFNRDGESVEKALKESFKRMGYSIWVFLMTMALSLTKTMSKSF